jgi:hypothetical protein
LLPFFSLFGALILGREATDVANICTCSPISSPVQCYHERNRGVRPEHRLHRQQDFSTLKAQLGGLEDAVSKQRLRHESTRKKREPPKH